MQIEQKIINPKIVSLASDKMFFEVFDTLTSKDKASGEIKYGPKYRMLKFIMLNHKQKVNGKSAWVWFSMHEREFLLVRNAILSRKLGTKGEGNHYVSYKGTGSTAYSTGFQSRIIEIEKQLPMNPPFRADVGNKSKIVFTIENGPGTKGKTGQVMPAGASGTDTKTKLMFALDEGVAIAMLEEVYMYLQGWHALNAKGIIDSHIEWADFRNDDNADNVENVVNITPDDVVDSIADNPEQLY